MLEAREWLTFYTNKLYIDRWFLEGLDHIFGISFVDPKHAWSSQHKNVERSSPAKPTNNYYLAFGGLGTINFGNFHHSLVLHPWMVPRLR